MFSVAIIGPDGAGKTTIGRRLETSLPLRVKYIYMGVNLDASNILLPTSRLIRAIKRACGAAPDRAGPPDLPTRVERPRKLLPRMVRSTRAALRLLHRASDEWFRQICAWGYQLRGYVVIFDRHYFADYYAYDIAPLGQASGFSRRLHGLMLRYLFPKPNLVIYLDAPGEVLLARKREGTVESLERRRSDYLQLGDVVNHFSVVDATQSADLVTEEVSHRILDHYRTRNDSQARQRPASRAAR